MKAMAIRVLQEDFEHDRWVLGVDDPNVQVAQQPLSLIVDPDGDGSTVLATLVVSEGTEVPPTGAAYLGHWSARRDHEDHARGIRPSGPRMCSVGGPSKRRQSRMDNGKGRGEGALGTEQYPLPS